jgi:hypothetical protein
MGSWNHKVEIKDLINDDTESTAARLRDKAREIVRRFHAEAPLMPMRTFNAVENFDGFVGMPDGEATEEEFNWCLNELYDAADRDRIWLGL